MQAQELLEQDANLLKTRVCRSVLLEELAAFHAEVGLWLRRRKPKEVITFWRVKAAKATIVEIVC